MDERRGAVGRIGGRLPAAVSRRRGAAVGDRLPPALAAGRGGAGTGAEKPKRLLAKAVEACPADGEAHRHYAEALWLSGANKEAIAQLQQSSRLMGDDASLSVRLAEMQLADNQIEPARQNAEQALALDPKLPGAWAVRGGVMRAAGQPQQALADYLRALGYSPNDRTILLAIAELHRELNQPDWALHTLQTLADTYSPGEEPGQVLFLMGMAYNALGRQDDSVESLKAAVAQWKAHARDVLRAGSGGTVGRPFDGSGGGGPTGPFAPTSTSAEP